MLCEWLMTLGHAVLCVVIVIGVLFSKTRVAQGAMLAIVLFLFIGIRIFKTCALDILEVCDNKPILTEIGMATIIKERNAVSKYEIEQAVVGTLLIVVLIKIYVLSIYPVDTLF
jgi:hypothetical protein